MANSSWEFNSFNFCYVGIDCLQQLPKFLFLLYTNYNGMYSKVNRTSWMIYMVFGNSKYNRSSWKSKQKMHCLMHLCNKELHIVIMLYKCSLLLFSKSENYLLINYDCTSYVLLGFRNTKINSLLKTFKIIQLILDNVKLHRIWKMLFKHEFHSALLEVTFLLFF